MASNQEELLARYREIDRLMAGSRRSAEFRYWQASAAELLRKLLGFHPAVVEFQGLRFRAGPVGAATAEELAAIPAEQHDARMRGDLAEAKRLLRRALTQLGLDPDAAPEPPAPADPVQAAAADLGEPARTEARQAAERLSAALRAVPPSWAAVAPELRTLLDLGLPVARAAIGAVYGRLSDLR
jgi:hypothetical protein